MGNDEMAFGRSEGKYGRGSKGSGKVIESKEQYDEGTGRRGRDMRCGEWK